MRGVFLIFILGGWVAAARAESALEALSHIPSEQAAHLAKIEGRGGSPEPDRWYILVYDGTSETGVHEFVVSDRKIVASRTLSQFADSLTPDDVIGADAIKTDSPQAGKLAGEYAGANGVSATSLDYELKKSADGSPPAWKISCLNDAGTPLGEVTVGAARGDVLSHDGFPHAPGEASSSPTAKPVHPVKAPKFDVYDPPVVAPSAVPSPSPEEESAATRRRRRAPQKQESGIGGAFKNFGHKVQHFFTF